MNIASNLGVRAQHEFLNTNDNSQDTINNVICKYENHPGIISIENVWKRQILFWLLKLSQKRKLGQ